MLHKLYMKPEQLVQPIDATHHLVKVKGELVGAQILKLKCTYDEGFNGKPDLAF